MDILENCYIAFYYKYEFLNIEYYKQHHLFKANLIFDILITLIHLVIYLCNRAKNTLIQYSYLKEEQKDYDTLYNKYTFPLIVYFSYISIYYLTIFLWWFLNKKEVYDSNCNNFDDNNEKTNENYIASNEINSYKYKILSCDSNNKNYKNKNCLFNLISLFSNNKYKITIFFSSIKAILLLVYLNFFLLFTNKCLIIDSNFLNYISSSGITGVTNSISNPIITGDILNFFIVQFSLLIIIILHFLIVNNKAIISLAYITGLIVNLLLNIFLYSRVKEEFNNNKVYILYIIICITVIISILLLEYNSKIEFLDKTNMSNKMNIHIAYIKSISNSFNAEKEKPSNDSNRDIQNCIRNSNRNYNEEELIESISNSKFLNKMLSNYLLFKDYHYIFNNIIDDDYEINKYNARLYSKLSFKIRRCNVDKIQKLNTLMRSNDVNHNISKNTDSKENIYNDVTHYNQVNNIIKVNNSSILNDNVETHSNQTNKYIELLNSFNLPYELQEILSPIGDKNENSNKNNKYKDNNPTEALIKKILHNKMLNKAPDIVALIFKHIIQISKKNNNDYINNKNDFFLSKKDTKKIKQDINNDTLKYLFLYPEAFNQYIYLGSILLKTRKSTNNSENIKNLISNNCSPVIIEDQSKNFLIGNSHKNNNNNNSSKIKSLISESDYYYRKYSIIIKAKSLFKYNSENYILDIHFIPQRKKVFQKKSKIVSNQSLYSLKNNRNIFTQYNTEVIENVSVEDDEYFNKPHNNSNNINSSHNNEDLKLKKQKILAKKSNNNVQDKDVPFNSRSSSINPYSNKFVSSKNFFHKQTSNINNINYPNNKPSCKSFNLYQNNLKHSFSNKKEKRKNSIYSREDGDNKIVKILESLSKITHEFKTPVINMTTIVDDIKREFKIIKLMGIKLLSNFIDDNKDLNNINEQHSNQLIIQEINNLKDFKSNKYKTTTNKLNNNNSNNKNICFNNNFKNKFIKTISEVSDKLKTIKGISRYVISLTHDFKFLAKKEANLELTAVKKRFNLKKLIKFVYDIFNAKIKAESKHINFNLIYEEDKCPKYLISDEQRITQILLNILSNSMKFTFSGDIFFQVEKIIFDGKDCVLFTVNDTGKGIDKEILENIKMPWAKSDQSSKNKDGAGLGLNIVYNLSKDITKYFNIDSEKGKGTKIQFSIEYNSIKCNRSIIKANTVFTNSMNDLNKLNVNNTKNNKDINNLVSNDSIHSETPSSLNDSTSEVCDIDDEDFNEEILDNYNNNNANNILNNYTHDNNSLLYSNRDFNLNQNISNHYNQEETLISMTNRNSNKNNCLNNNYLNTDHFSKNNLNDSCKNANVPNRTLSTEKIENLPFNIDVFLTESSKKSMKRKNSDLLNTINSENTCITQKLNYFSNIGLNFNNNNSFNNYNNFTLYPNKSTINEDSTKNNYHNYNNIFNFNNKEKEMIKLVSPSQFLISPEKRNPFYNNTSLNYMKTNNTNANHKFYSHNKSHSITNKIIHNSSQPKNCLLNYNNFNNNVLTTNTSIANSSMRNVTNNMIKNNLTRCKTMIFNNNAPFYKKQVNSNVSSIKKYSLNNNTANNDFIENSPSFKSGNNNYMNLVYNNNNLSSKNNLNNNNSTLLTKTKTKIGNYNIYSSISPQKRLEETGKFKTDLEKISLNGLSNFNSNNYNIANNSNNNTMKEKEVYNILIVDDVQNILTAEKNVLTNKAKEKGLIINIICCSDGAECIYELYKSFYTGNMKYDMVITDAEMYFIKGEQLVWNIQLLKKDDKIENELIVVLMTAHDFLEIEGVDVKLEKPFSKNSANVVLNMLVEKNTKKENDKKKRNSNGNN